MKWKTVKKGNKWVKRLELDADDWLCLVTLLVVACFIVLQLIIGV